MRRLLSVLSCLVIVVAGLVALLASAPAASAAPHAASPAQGGTFHGVDSVRVLDTRTTGGLAAARPLRFAVGGRDPVPADADAVAVNITVLTPAKAGSVSVYPGDTEWNGAASISFVAGQTKQSMITAKLGSDGSLAIRNNSAATIQVIGDVAGYYAGGTASVPGSFHAIGFQRVFDTRPVGAHPLYAGSETSVLIAGRGDIPASGVAGVVANLTVLNPARSGSVSTYPNSGAWDGSASVSFAAGRTEQDALPISLGSNGAAIIRNNTGVDLQAVLDVIGYFLAGTPTDNGSYQPIGSVRLLDERLPAGASDPRLQPGEIRSIAPAQDAVPRWGVPAAVIRFTLITPVSAGSFSVFPGDRSWNGAASISFPAGASVQQYLVTPLGRNGELQIRNNTASPLTVVADVLGYYLGEPNPLHLTSGSVIDPQRGYLQNVSCPTATFCMAAEGGGYVVSWHGSSWSAPVQVPQASSLTEVSCVSASFCMAAGAGTGGKRIFRYDGTSWTTATTLANQFREAHVSCASASFCLATGSGSYRTFDGANWSSELSMPGSPLALSCTSASFCMAADHTDGKLYSFDGTGWSSPVTMDAFHPAAVDCTSATFCVAVGEGNAATFDGAAWTLDRNIYWGSTALRSVSCSSSTFCFALDNSGQLDFFDGHSWSDQGWENQPNGGTSISCPTDTFCLLVGGGTIGTSEYFDGVVWSAQQTVDVPSEPLDDLSCTSASFCIAVDGGGYALRYDGTGWSTPVLVTSGIALEGVVCTSPIRCIAVDQAGRAVTFNGTTWSTPVPVDAGHALTAIACSGPTFCVAVAADGKAASYDGTTWSIPVAVSTRPLIAVSCPSSTFCLALDDNSGSATYDGTAWSPAATLPQPANEFLSCPTSDFCLASQNARAASWQNGVWANIPTALDTSVALSCPTAQLCLALDPSAMLTAWDGSTWTMPVKLTNAHEGRPHISCPTSDFCMAVDGYASAFRLDN